MQIIPNTRMSFYICNSNNSKTPRKRDAKRKIKAQNTKGRNAARKSTGTYRARKTPARRAPAKNMLDTQSIFELIMPWKTDLPKLADIKQ